MAEKLNSTELVPKPNGAGVLDGEYIISVKDVDAAGQTSTLTVAMPSAVDFNTWSLVQRAALLKKTLFKNMTMPEIAFAVMYADRLGLDIIAGDVYHVDGRLNTTNKAKIKYALNSGKIEGYEIDVLDLSPKKLVLKKKVAGTETTFEHPELEAVVLVTVKGWTKPLKYSARLSEWYTPSNPNWVARPAYMLRLNALAHALNEVAPMGLESEEAPPVADAAPSVQVPTLEELKKQ